MNIALTGHTGFLGTHVAERLCSKHNAFGVSRSSSVYFALPGYQLDITDCETLTRVFAEKQVECVVHCAAKVIVADCDRDPFGAFQTNSLGTASVLQAARDAGARKVVVVETDKVYGEQACVPTMEDADLNPGSAYELSKAVADEFCEFYGQDIEVIRVRPANLFGPGDHLYTRFVPAAMRAVANGEPIPVHKSAADTRRDFLYVSDAANMIATLVEKPSLFGVYNLSRNESVTILEFADLIAHTLSHQRNHQYPDKPGEYVEIKTQSIGGERFVDEFGFEFTPMRDAILETYDFYKQWTTH